MDAISVLFDSSLHVFTDHQPVLTEVLFGDRCFINAGDNTAPFYLFHDDPSNDASFIVFRISESSLYEDNELVDCVI